MSQDFGSLITHRRICFDCAPSHHCWLQLTQIPTIALAFHVGLMIIDIAALLMMILSAPQHQLNSRLCTSLGRNEKWEGKKVKVNSQFFERRPISAHNHRAMQGSRRSTYCSQLVTEFLELEIHCGEMVIRNSLSKSNCVGEKQIMRVEPHKDRLASQRSHWKAIVHWLNSIRQKKNHQKFIFCYKFFRTLALFHFPPTCARWHWNCRNNNRARCRGSTKSKSKLPHNAESR